MEALRNKVHTHRSWFREDTEKGGGVIYHFLHQKESIAGNPSGKLLTTEIRFDYAYSGLKAKQKYK